jgi:conjugal transfer pilin signal peptidase TrbI
MLKKIMFVSMIGAALFYLLDFLSESYGLMINQSQSLPYRLFLRVKGKPDLIDRGVMIAFSHPLSKQILAKEIAGLPGDEIKIENDRIYVHGQEIGILQKATSKGISLNPITERVVNEGCIFVRGTHERSFDSRYAEFGLVPIERVQDKLEAIF